VCVHVCVDLGVRVDRVANSKEGLEAGGHATTEFHDPERDAREPVGADLSQIWDIAGGGA